MKKIGMLLILIAGISASAIGYYVFYLKPPSSGSEDVEVVNDGSSTDSSASKPTSFAQDDHTNSVKTTYYVSVPLLQTYQAPSEEAVKGSIHYFGDKLSVLEQADGWGRISPYYVYKEGDDEVAKWVPMSSVQLTVPTQSEEERRAMISHYIDESDHFERYSDAFVDATDHLLNEGICSLADLNATGGWIESVQYHNGHVFFLYCGGLQSQNKVYVDAESGETFL